MKNMSERRVGCHEDSVAAGNRFTFEDGRYMNGS